MRITELLFLLLIIGVSSSCQSQSQDKDKKNDHEQQVERLIGKWSSASNSQEGIDTLIFHNESNYSIDIGGHVTNGKWKVMDLLHLSLDKDKYQFYFNGQNLVLTSDLGEKIQFRNHKKRFPIIGSTPNVEEPISQFVRRIFEDQEGNLWLGTNGNGVARISNLKGNPILEYFTLYDGFNGSAVRSILEDLEGNVWFGTNRGINKFDGKEFYNYGVKDGLVDNDVWSMSFDDKGVLWVGTYAGVSKFDGKQFYDFRLPATQPDSTRGVTSPHIIHAIMQDSRGYMWFGSNGGVFIIKDINAPEKLIIISESEGLCNDMVNDFLEDQYGNIWFATHHKGICRIESTAIDTYLKSGNRNALSSGFLEYNTDNEVNGVEAWSLYEDQSGDIWFPTEGFGVYRYNHQKDQFTNYHKKEGLVSGAIQCVHQDKSGNIWLGGYEGLFKYLPQSNISGKDTIISVSRKGPW